MALTELTTIFSGKRDLQLPYTIVTMRVLQTLKMGATRRGKSRLGQGQADSGQHSMLPSDSANGTPSTCPTINALSLSGRKVVIDRGLFPFAGNTIGDGHSAGLQHDILSGTCHSCRRSTCRIAHFAERSERARCRRLSLGQEGGSEMMRTGAPNRFGYEIQVSPFSAASMAMATG